MQLVIAEKPSVALSIATAICPFCDRKNGYYEGGNWIISWCFGHLAELADAHFYNADFAKWKLEHLPIIPYSFRFHVREDKRTQYDILRNLMMREDVTDVVNACDAGREGELIFRTVYCLAGCSKPIKRLWISSMEDAAIQEGFQQLQPGSDYDGLHRSALCRAKADWLVGINATRLFSLTYNRTLNIGRVMSPTLALVVQREAEISAFTPEPFYTVVLDCDFPLSSERMKSKEEASAIAAACKGQPVTVTQAERKEKSENAPALYDLTTLQRDANRLLGYTAQQTLDYLQSLYEKRLCTYPRTDSRYLTDDMASSVPEYVKAAAHVYGCQAPDPVYAKNVCNSKKVSDHHAIVPTLSARQEDISKLPTGEQEVLKLVARGLLRGICPELRYAEVNIAADCAGHSFTAKGKEMLSPGWTVFDKRNEEKAEQLPTVKEGQRLDAKGCKLKEGKTTPPKFFTEDTLLSAMENAGKEDMPEDAERRGIGTPATRAGILEKLVSAQFLQRKKASKVTYLHPTPLGTALITVLPEQLQSPQLTAEWEHRLKEVEQGELDADAFLSGICTMLQELVKSYAAPPGADVLFPPEHEAIGKCPRCGSSVLEYPKGFFCDKKDCKFALWKSNRFFEAKKKALTKPIAAALLKSGKAPLKGCHSEKTGKSYDATVVMAVNGDKVEFKLEFPHG